MLLDFANLNWFAILACVIAGQIILTIWFVALFAEPWAKEYGAASAKEHTAAVPPWTYGVGAFCVFLLSIGIATLQRLAGITGVGDAIALGVFIAICFSAATALPGYAFLKRWTAFALAMGSQVAVILVHSMILAVWR